MADALSRIELQVHNSELESSQATCANAGHTKELELSSIHVDERPLNDFNTQLIIGPTISITAVTPFRNKKEEQ